MEYRQLRDEADYEKLGHTLRAAQSASTETARIVYLSISPSLYESVVSHVDAHLRPHHGVPLRVVFEKPFGKDTESAQQLTDVLLRHLKEQEIYRVDHYLGKLGLKSIALFRRLNLPLLNALQLPPPSASSSSSSSTSRRCLVEVALTETEDVRGRTGFYDEYGVVRDVMQNHMTQVTD